MERLVEKSHVDLKPNKNISFTTMDQCNSAHPKYVWTSFPKMEWEQIRRQPFDKMIKDDQPEWNWNDQVKNFIISEVCKRSFINNRETHPITAYFQKPPSTWSYRQRVICKIRIDDEKQIVPYDDAKFVSLLNTLGNGWPRFLALSKAEDDRMENATLEQIEASYQRVFDLTTPRDPAWVQMEPRLFIPCLTRNMIVKYQVYDGQKKSKKKLRKAKKLGNKEQERGGLGSNQRPLG